MWIGERLVQRKVLWKKDDWCTHSSGVEFSSWKKLFSHQIQCFNNSVRAVQSVLKNRRQLINLWEKNPM